jgi:hypothetical protein
VIGADPALEHGASGHAVPAAQATSSAHVVCFPWVRAWWAAGEVAATRRLLSNTAGVGFAVVGRGSGGNGTRDVNRTLSPRRIVVIVDWTDPGAATRGRVILGEHWRSRGALVWSAGLVPLRSTGSWRGATPFQPDASGTRTDAASQGPIASLTYARIRPSKAAHFYLLGFPRAARRMIGPDSPLLAAIGFGDVPVRHACTLSLWPSPPELDRMVAGRREPHGIVARRSVEEGWLSESLFARFVVVDHTGTWAGGDPLA